MQVTVNSFKKIVDQRWCVITRGIPFILILLSLKVLSNLNLVTFVSTNVLGHLLLKKPRSHFISMSNKVICKGTCLTNSQSRACL